MTASARPARNGRGSTSWALLSAPGTAWLLALFVVPFYAVAAVAFGQVDPILRTAAPIWNPLRWDTGALTNVLERVFGGDLGSVFVRTITYVVITLALCCLIGYPVAYYAARHARRGRAALLVALVLPFWISYLMRMLAWVNLLQADGYVNRMLEWLNVLDAPRNWLDGDAPTVILGLVYGYLPFFILPLYAALERLDGRLVEASRDLGASPRQAFLRVTLPLSVPGLMAASVITILPMFGDYYTNSYLSGGSPRTEMVGNQIEFYLRGSSQPQTGASLVLILSALLLVLMTYYLVTTMRAQRQATT